jgi:microcompartment protein CcmK/EutM
MLIGRVVGTLVSEQKDPKLAGMAFLVVRPLDIEGRDSAGYVVAADAVGAGTGDVVLYASGSSARQTEVTDRRPVDAVIMAIVDLWEIGGEVKYRKTPADGVWAS